MSYWDAEDGSDCFTKTWILSKLGAGLGLIGVTYHIVAFQPKTALEGLQRATTATLTMASLGAIFGMTTCLAAQLREKPEDPLNYFIGGCASGVFMGVRTHNYMTGTTACLALGTVAALTKIGKKEGWKLVGPPEL
ncbi:NADH dehydrogenase [ubiquinone] 1 alpha subcomplex subunit 11 [Rhinatrema bivittatum]|uniref:NADH dehydrogenase [ubiquinone] 1 alpha subcomplex subunit 11 n=1 Tax=Rhinatrema bivittatum TaxID=194408 RepID=UPI001127D2A1|nr:NADH dehydrogenase [ubiquinone] 1 alpha subcomplex subunit 11 [Rhinatrema bivittatum]